VLLLTSAFWVTAWIGRGVSCPYRKGLSSKDYLLKCQSNVVRRCLERRQQNDDPALCRGPGRRLRDPPVLCRGADPGRGRARHRLGAQRGIHLRQERAARQCFLDYRVPVSSDMPIIEPILVEVPNPAHPFGAKGVGEVNIVPPMAAIANAIDSAIHRRLTELPMSPPKIRAAPRRRLGGGLGALLCSRSVAAGYCALHIGYDRPTRR
jgi:hypothetical protein